MTILFCLAAIVICIEGFDIIIGLAITALGLVLFGGVFAVMLYALLRFTHLM